jgi:lysyl-tRNA synthetase class 2
MSIPSFNEIIEQNDQTEARAASLAAIAALVGNVYPNKFARTNISGGEDTITALKHFAKVADVESRMAEIKASLGEGERPPADKKDALNEELKALGTVRIAGRLTTPTRGNFVHLTDGVNKLQVYCNKKGPLALIKNDGANTLDEENGWTLWQLLDHGDLIGAEGYLFVTNTGEVSVHVEKLQFLAKAMLPMPDKMHGIADPELQRRFRYADLIASSLQVKAEPPALAGGTTSTGTESSDNDHASTIASTSPAHAGGSALTTREVFERRAKLISGMRRFLDDAGFIEVETPMLTPKATGAAAKPFETHHNALDIPLYARVAPELYLKRLVVGGFEKVYELNRNFRNEGLSQRHNPEFTMLEFYIAYMDVNGMMDFCEKILQDSVQKAIGGLTVKISDVVRPPLDWGGGIERSVEIDFGTFQRLTMREAIIQNFPTRWGVDDLGECFDDSVKLGKLNLFVHRMFIKEEEARFSPFVLDDASQEVMEVYERTVESIWEDVEKIFVRSNASNGTLLTELFELVAEKNLTQPTFIVDYPKSISPLSKASPTNPEIAERFELFIAGMEVANGFSELNDPKEQYERFVDQMSERERGDDEAMIMDEDYIRALSYGMPPAAGIGIGIDRLVMLLTNKHSIRDVILFPHMRPEKRNEEKEEDN